MLTLLLLIPPVWTIAWILYRALWVPENHIGFDPYLFMLAASFSLVSAWLSRGISRHLALALSVLMIAVVAWMVVCVRPSHLESEQIRDSGVRA